MRNFLSAPHNARFLAFLIGACAVLGLVYVGLLLPLLSGLLAFSLIAQITAALKRHGPNLRRARGLAIGFLFIIVVGFFVGMGSGLHLILHDGAGFHELLDRMADIIASARAWLPSRVGDMIPQTDSLFDSVANWLKGHAAELGTLSLDVAKDIGYALIGILLGALIAVSELAPPARLGPASNALLVQVAALRDVFWRVATAQVKISALNTSLTAIYLMLVLPLFGVHLPFSKTMVTSTFVAGLLPVVGNLLSNTAITVISLGNSLPVALASLAFLIGVHKLEYFLNARIVGGQINARSWEILVTMLLFERLFGLRGVVIAPIFYAWLKSEWHRWDQPNVARTFAATKDLETTP
ncbi:MAG: AI-2E family transporter [Burkholderiaceae bacterium]|jgi:predicted PurR-regulated permease PerM